MSFLAIDVGNTRLKWARYASPQPGAALLSQGAVFLEMIDHLADTDLHTQFRSRINRVMTGSFQNGRVQKRVTGAIGKFHEAETLLRVEPLHGRFYCGTARRRILPRCAQE